MALFSNSPILVKDEVGKVRPTLNKLPPETHVYGKQYGIKENEEGAGDVIFNYQYGSRAKLNQPEVLDFKKINKVKLKPNYDTKVSKFFKNYIHFLFRS